MTTNTEAFLVEHSQPATQTLVESGSITASAEVFPAVWGALSDLVCPDVRVRQQGLENLVSYKAHRLLPVVAYILSTSLMDSDIHFRAKVCRVIADVFRKDEEGKLADQDVRSLLLRQLSQMRLRPVYGLVQVAAEDDTYLNDVELVLNGCSYAGIHLVTMLTNRKTPLALRKLSIYFIGKIGYLDAVPELEKLQSYLEARQNDNRSLIYTSSNISEDQSLLYEVKGTLYRLVNL